MTLLVVKVLLAPSFVVGASLVARRYGPTVGGLIGGLPVVAGPVLLAYALEHGRSFAASAASGTLLGLISLIAFVVVYARVAGRLSWGASMLAGWLAFVALTALFTAVTVPAGVALALAALAVLAGLLALPSPRAGAPEDAHPPPPVWDLPLRGLCALVLVLVLTAVAGWLGPQLSGLLAPFPIIATVLATFTHAQRGTDELLRLLRGLISGFGAFALFCFSLAVSLPHVETGPAFALATGLALLVQGTLIAIGRVRTRTAAPVLPEL